MPTYLMEEEELGKTSAAKIFARAINCLNPKDGEPCNECEICKGILAGSLTDVVEMDAASNNSVEDIRTIRDEVNFLPTLAKYRVYIIDEVHMLSTGAFNALLKTLEEPPEHVKFILATTEPQKLPATILSRCQRFDFKRISNQDIIKRLKIVCEQSQIQATDEALRIISILAEGALRDALSLLERCLQEGTNQIQEDKVKELIGIPNYTSIYKIVKHILNYQVQEALSALEEVLLQGKDLNNLIWEIIKYIKDILVYKTSKTQTIYNQEEAKQIEELSRETSQERIIEIIYSLSELENTIKWSTQKNILLETGIIKLCTKQNSSGIKELQDRITQLEQNIKEINLLKNQPTQVIQNEPISKKQPKIQQNKAEITKNAGINLDKIKSEEFWAKVLRDLKTNGKMMLYSNLINTKAIQANDMTVEIIFPNGLTAFGRSLLEKPENIKELVTMISIACGKEMKIKYIDAKTEEISKTKNIEEMVKDLEVPVQIIEE